MRRVFDEMLGSAPLPDDVRTRTIELGGVPAVEVRAGAAPPAGTALYFHGGAYAMGSAAASVGLVSEIARRAAATVLSVDYRLAPEHPFPAAVDDALAACRALLDGGVPAGSVAVTGESAGGGLALALLLAIRDAGLPQPSSATVLSPWADLTQSGGTMSTRAEADPALTRRALQIRAADYLAGADPRTPLASPLHADLRGLPPLLIQAGAREILLDDALRLAARAARADILVTLQTFPGAPHVFQGFAPLVEEAARALDHVAAFLNSHIHPEG
ncbi:alpha/beta hydrolase fold domain-containing protein [Streptomyces sp. TG1A-8]|uniref:alpha/beta hydrolase fold domain-containing protein n=1 Tax=Streptomyces sp. TG1A-8 TaxID=3051385 RepID=UPI00265B83E8|nr:alpha/beta hydrolase fold domain-containing protein [Streptomyces sp. TG1A-8]MDO0929818.1 alpha/beta hydrolase fold domain-containing protein [Streptomyces sp. TG1A-8]